MTSHWFDPRMVGMWSPGSVPWRHRAEASDPTGRRCDVHSFVHDEGPVNSAGGVDPYLGRSDADECSVSSESCWGEQKDLIDEEN